MMSPVVVKQLMRTIMMKSRRLMSRRLSVNLNPACKITEYGASGYHTFFGYHDITPFGSEDRILLATRCLTGNKLQTAGTPLQLGYYDLSHNEPSFEHFADTTAWCWQQSCRIQWYPNDSGSLVFFNKSERGRHLSCIFDLENQEEVKTYDRALYAISPNGQSGISLNFARLQNLRPGYGYGDIVDSTRNQVAPDADGLWLLEFNNGDCKLILSLKEISAFEPESSMNGAFHYFNHVLWSPCSRYFFFLHLWQASDSKRRSRAFIWSMDSETFKLLGPRDLVSHHCWVDDDHLIVYSKEPTTGMKYHRYGITEGSVDIIGDNVLKEDGHPSMSTTNQNLMVTDTYPNHVGEQSLLLFNIKSQQLKVAAELYSPSSYRGESRCDLHPRWNRAGNKICVDSAHHGERKICIIDVGEIIREI